MYKTWGNSLQKLQNKLIEKYLLYLKEKAKEQKKKKSKEVGKDRCARTIE